MNVPLKLILLMLTALILNGCSSAYRQPYRYTPAYTPTYTPTYNNSTFNSTPASKPASRATSQSVAKQTYKPSYQTQYLAQAVASNTPRYEAAPLKVALTSPPSKPLPSLDDLIRFEYDCTRKIEQIDYLQEVLRKKTFYKIDGVEGNEYSDRINKRYYALARYRIWSLRLGCKGSNVEKMTEISLKARSPSAAPESVPRCYFEESVVASTELNKSNGGEEVFSKRKEFCTNYPLIADKKVVFIGDVVDPERQLDKNIAYIPNLRKWNGTIFQMLSKTEIHLREVVKFTVVLMWNGAAWVVVDKF